MTNDKDIRNKTIGFVSLGCDKNRVDLEKMIFKCKQHGFKIESNPFAANIIIVNTCSFIESARKESIDNILEMANYKINGNLEKLIVTGCLNQMNYMDLESSLPEVDSFIKINNNNNIVEAIYNCYGINLVQSEYNSCSSLNRILTTESHYAYLKIADGCDNFCSYCTIPFIRGRYKSVPMESVIAEAIQLAKNGVKEIILVAQDVTKYGIDFGEIKIVELIQKLSQIKEIKWIRLLYCYPELVSNELINEIKNNPKVCKYIDLPLQHVNNRILKAMNRKNTKEKTIELLTKLKKEIPNIVIRSTFILGFPGETDEEYQELLDFLKHQNLQYVGFFAYSKEDGTIAATLKNQITKTVKNTRVKHAYKMQEQILKEFHKSLENQTFLAIIDYIDNNNVAIARTPFLCPNVDPVVFVKNIKNNISTGEFVPIKITKTNSRLEGEIIYEPTK